MPYPPLEERSKSNFLEMDAQTLPVNSITVLIVDDHALIHAAISQVLSAQHEVKHIVTAQNYDEAEALAAELHPDIIWLDMHVANSDGIAEIQRLKRLFPDSRIMALADVENEQEGFAAIMAGAQGYRSKQDVHPDEIMIMICMLCHNELVLRPVLLTCVVQRLRTEAMPRWRSERGGDNRKLLRNVEYNGLDQLTTREREVLPLICQGYRDRDIAEGLHISEKTAQKHVHSILSKLGAQNRTEVAFLIHHQWIA